MMEGAEADAGAGGAGAPPPTSESNKVAAGLTREYARSEIRIQWFASRCIHSAACIRALPAVFNPRRRPWVDVGAADVDAIAEAVVRCPTGALQYVRADGGPDERPAPTVQVTPVRNGPYLIRGAMELVDQDGRVVERTNRVALCRCGQSKHMPRCDNTHRAIGFRSDA
jgi:uncharacterized Fe-S cluster protein YjdI